MVKTQIMNKVVDRYKAGETVSSIAAELGIGKSTVYSWIQQKSPRTEPYSRSKYTPQQINEFCTRVRAGEKQVHVARDLGINPVTANTWLKTHKEPVTTYTTAFKRNVIGSLQAGRSMHEVQKTFNLTQAEIHKWIDEFKEGKYDPTVVQHAIKATVPAPATKPAIETMSISALDSVLDVIKTLTAKGVAMDTAVDISKSLITKLK